MYLWSNSDVEARALAPSAGAALDWWRQSLAVWGPEVQQAFGRLPRFDRFPGCGALSGAQWAQVFG